MWDGSKHRVMIDIVSGVDHSLAALVPTPHTPDTVSGAAWNWQLKSLSVVLRTTGEGGLTARGAP